MQPYAFRFLRRGVVLLHFLFAEMGALVARVLFAERVFCSIRFRLSAFRSPQRSRAAIWKNTRENPFLCCSGRNTTRFVPPEKIGIHAVRIFPPPRSVPSKPISDHGRARWNPPESNRRARMTGSRATEKSGSVPSETAVCKVSCRTLRTRIQHRRRKRKTIPTSPRPSNKNKE